MEESDIQFIFREEDFDDDNFDGSQFVAKYRKVTTLESLREQLVIYSNRIRKQLYVIINRDYQDFINISSKLDGLDTRIDMIQRPLMDLQIDFSSLHNGIASSLHTIQDQLDRQQQVKIKKFYVENLLKSMDLLKNAQEAIQFDNFSSNDNDATQAITRHQLFRIYLSETFIENHDPTDVLQEKDLFISSEYERAAVFLSTVQTNVTKLQELIKSTAGNANLVVDASLQVLLKSVIVDSNKAKDLLLSKLLTHLENDFTQAFTTEVGKEDKKNEDVLDTFDLSDGLLSSKQPIHLRCFAHCIKAALHLKAYKQVEECLRKNVIEPYAKSILTPGRIDGKLGRGSYSGLASTIQSFIRHIQQTELPHYLRVAEEMSHLLIKDNFLTPDAPTSSSSSSPTSASSSHITPKFDLIVHSIWLPIQQILQEKYGSLFTTGITSTFSITFRALMDFFIHLSEIVPKQSKLASLLSDTENDVNYTKVIFERLAVHPHIQKTLSLFQMDIYYSLRCKEMMTRLDKVFDMHWKTSMLPSRNTGSSPPPSSYENYQNTEKLLEYIYKPSSVTTTTTTTTGPASANNTTSTTVRPADNHAVLLSLEYDVVMKLYSDHLSKQGSGRKDGFHHPFLLICLLESYFLQQEDIVLLPLVSKFLLFHQKCMYRLLVHVALMMNLVNFPLLANLTGSEFENMRYLYCQELTPTDQQKLQQFQSQQLQQQQSTGSKASRKEFLSPEKNLTKDTTTTIVAAVGTSIMSIGLSISSPRVITTLDEWIYLLVDLHYVHMHLQSSYFQNMKKFITSLQQKFSVVSHKEEKDEEVVESMLRTIYQPVFQSTQQLLNTLWTQLLQLIGQECRRPLVSVKGIAGKYRMTNKPSPTAASTYVETILQPLKQILNSFPNQMHQLANDLQSSTTTALDGFAAMKYEIIENILVAFQEQVNSLMETVKQMDTALQRRAVKVKSNESSTQLSDVEKISLQVKLDVVAFGEDIRSMGINPLDSTIYQQLFNDVNK